MSSKGQAGEKEQPAERYWFPHTEEGYVVGEVLHHDHDRDVLSVALEAPEGKAVRSSRPSGLPALGQRRAPALGSAPTSTCRSPSR